MKGRLRTLGPRVATLDGRTARPPAKTVDPHYQTQGHRHWAEAVIRRADGRCEDPDHDPRRPRTGIRLFADHIKELRDGGAPFDPTNGMCRCGSCHARKTIAARARRHAST